MHHGAQAAYTANTLKMKGNAPATVVNAVKYASAKTGVDFSYLMEKAAAESGYKTNAKAKTSSARGLYQFIDSTWLDTMARHGDKHGLGVYAEQIRFDERGRPRVDDPKMRQTILNMRNDARISALMAGEFAADNKAHLESRLNKKAGATEMYFAHFLGAGGAVKFLKTMQASPDKTAAEVMPKAARANKNVFYDPATGKPRTMKEVYAFFDKKFTAPAVADTGTQFARNEVNNAVMQMADAGMSRPSYAASIMSSPLSGQTLSPGTIMILAELTADTVSLAGSSRDEDGVRDARNDRASTGFWMA